MLADTLTNLMRNLTIIIVVALVLLTTKTFSQNINFPIDTATGKIMFSEVIYLDSVSKATLYIKAREWFVKSFKSSKAVLELEDIEAGKLIGKGNFTAMTEESMNDNEFIKRKGLVSKELREKKNKGEVGSVSFLISLYIKDGRYKYEITDLSHKGMTTTVAGYTATQPDGGDLSNIDPVCSYSEWMPKIRWKNIKVNSLVTIQSLIADLKSTMAAKDKTENF